MQKLSTLFSFFLLISLDTYGQADTIFFDKNWNVRNRSEAVYYRLVVKNGKKYVVTDYFLKNNLPQMVALCSSSEPEIKDGKCTYFNEDGSKSSEGLYKANNCIGLWTFWDEDGKDSSIAEYQEDGTRKWVHTSGSMQKKLNTPFTYVEEMPQYPGGQTALSQFLKKNLKYPKEARKNKIEGKVVVQFVVDQEGKINDVVVLRDIGGGCGDEAVRVIKLMPPWKPGKQNGSPVNVYFKLPITFKI